MDEFDPLPGSDSRGITVPACKDRGKVELDVTGGSNTESPGCIDSA